MVHLGERVYGIRMSERAVELAERHVPPSAASPWAPLRNPSFRAVWLASTVSNVGTWMQNTGAAWMMTSLSASPLMVALIQTATSLPFFLFALPAGALADIVDRRRLLWLTQAWMLIVALALGVLTLLGRIDAWMLLALTFALGVGGALTAPAWQAFVPDLVPRRNLSSAVALNGVSFNIARAIGPALGGIVVAAQGSASVFLINAASFVAVLVVLSRARIAGSRSSLPRERVVGAMRAGTRYVRHSRPYHAVLVRSAVFIMPASALWALLPLVARELSFTAVGYGLLLGCLGTGALGGAWLLPRLRARWTADQVVAWATVAFAAATALLGVVRIVPIVAAAMVAGGVAWMVGMSTLSIAAQNAAPAWVRARALAISLLVVQGGLAVGSLLWGAVAAKSGTGTALVTGGAALLASVAAGWRYRLHGLDELDLTPNPHWRAPVILGEVDVERTPVLVTVEYDVDPAKSASFTRALHELAATRRRDGAVYWGLYRDAEHPEHFVETFIVPSWLEHLRQHERITAADQRLERQVRDLVRSPPTVTHLVGVLD